MKHRHALIGDDAFIVDGLLTEPECTDLLEFAERVGFDRASIDASTGRRFIDSVRNNARATVDDEQLAAQLFERVRPFLPSIRNDCRAIGINERFRFYRYEEGQKFDWHKDGIFRQSTGERSYFTFMVYLNEDCDGGTTSFRAQDVSAPAKSEVSEYRVLPRIGRGLLFAHWLWHRGDPVLAGRKYVLRTDVMFDGEPEFGTPHRELSSTQMLPSFEHWTGADTYRAQLEHAEHLAESVADWLWLAQCWNHNDLKLASICVAPGQLTSPGAEAEERWGKRIGQCIRRAERLAQTSADWLGCAEAWSAALSPATSPLISCVSGGTGGDEGDIRHCLEAAELAAQDRLALARVADAWWDCAYDADEAARCRERATTL